MSFIETDVCKKCGGNGYLKEYWHIQNGICFSCGGSGHSTHQVINRVDVPMRADTGKHISHELDEEIEPPFNINENNLIPKELQFAFIGVNINHENKEEIKYIINCYERLEKELNQALGKNNEDLISQIDIEKNQLITKIFKLK
jgi:hypothetical protein